MSALGSQERPRIVRTVEGGGDRESQGTAQGRAGFRKLAEREEEPVPEPLEVGRKWRWPLMQDPGSSKRGVTH